MKNEKQKQPDTDSNSATVAGYNFACGRWINIEDELPNDKEVVLIKTNEQNVFGHNGELMQLHIATFVKGKTKEELENSKTFCGADEWGNNLRPYRWDGDGPCDWFGQEVEYWSRINKPSKQ